MKLKNLFDTFLKKHPIIPPSVVPNVPKNKPNSVVFIISIFSPLLDFIIIYAILFIFFLIGDGSFSEKEPSPIRKIILINLLQPH